MCMPRSLARPTAVLLLLAAAALPLQAQLLTAPAPSPEFMAAALAGPGVTVSDVVLDCATGASGLFDASATVLPIDSGIMLTTGRINLAKGPNNSGSEGEENFTPGDPDLSALIGGTATRDACILSFDVEVSSDSLVFRYVFGSEEYLEFVGTDFNDVFAFWIEGPGFPVPTNIASIPGTTTPVAINTVNDASFPAYYVDNGNGATPPFDSDDSYIQYDGYTTLLVARANVVPCETYRLRLAIADGFDGIYDSGVFLEANSLTSGGVSLSASTSVGSGYEGAVEGCVDGVVTFERAFATSSPLDVSYGIGGSATNGVDYLALSGTVTIPAGAASADVIISPILDALPEPEERVIIYVYSVCDSAVLDSAVVSLFDQLPLSAVPDGTLPLCDGDTTGIRLLASGGLSYLWTPATGLDDPTSPSPWANPGTATTYTVQTVVGTCTAETEITVDYAPPVIALAGQDQSICLGQSAVLSGSGGLSYAWSPVEGLSDPGSAETSASPDSDTWYTLTATDAAGCSGTDSMLLTVNPLPDALAAPDTTLCAGSSVMLQASGGVAYLWSPAEGLSDPASPFPIWTSGSASQTFVVQVTDANGCRSEASVLVQVEAFPDVDAGPDTLVFLGEAVQLLGSGSGSFLWSPAEGLSDPGAAQPWASPLQSTWYVLGVASPAGCLSLDSMWLQVITSPIVEFPNAFSPNGDGINDLFVPIVRGPVSEVVLMIFNRWGQLVFESSDPAQGWDGSFKGLNQELGAYTFVFRALDPEGAPIARRGTVLLVR